MNTFWLTVKFYLLIVGLSLPATANQSASRVGHALHEKNGLQKEVLLALANIFSFGVIESIRRVQDPLMTEKKVGAIVVVQAEAFALQLKQQNAELEHMNEQMGELKKIFEQMMAAQEKKEAITSDHPISTDGATSLAAAV